MSMRKKALVVDDQQINREILAEMLETDFDVYEAENGERALDLIRAHSRELSVLFLDLMMPVMDGFSVMETLIKEKLNDTFPILIITGETDSATEERCLNLGATDFITKPFNPVLVHKRAQNAANMAMSREELRRKVDEQTHELREQNERLLRTNENTMELLGDVVEARSLESGTHIKRVRSFTRILAEKMAVLYPDFGLTEEKIHMISLAAAMHDIGKIRVSDAILLKPGKLTKDEFEEMKRHTVYGCELLERSRSMWEPEYFALCREICLCHHEKWDGKGYPNGLSGDDIPLSAQLVSVADCYDALTTERVYKRAYTPDEAYAMIAGGQCGAFSPAIKESLSACRDEFRQEAEKSSARKNESEAIA